MPTKILWIALWMTLTYWLGGFWGCAAQGDDQNYEILEDDPQMFQTEPQSLQSREDIARELDIALEDPYGQPEPVVQAETTPTVPEPSTTPVETPAAEQPSEVVATQPVEQPTETVVSVETAEPVEHTPPVVVEEPTPVATVEPPALEPGSAEPAPVTLEPEIEKRVVEAPAPGVRQLQTTSGGTLTVRGVTEPSVTGVDRSHWARRQAGPDDGRTWHQPHYFEDVQWHDKPSHKTKQMEDGATVTNEAEFLAAMDGQNAKGWLDATNAADMVVQPAKAGIDLGILPIMAILQPPFIWVSTPQ